MKTVLQKHTNCTVQLGITKTIKAFVLLGFFFGCCLIATFIAFIAP